MNDQPRVLFVCVENACRSQMAAAFARLHGGGRVAAYSAGSRPADAIDHSGNGFVDQFVHGRADGPIKMPIRPL